MRKAHAAMDITAANFAAVVALLRRALDASAIPAPVQEEFIATLMPLQAEIVNAP